MKISNRRVDWLITTLIGLAFGLLYVSSAASGLTGLADSDEIVGVSLVGGLVHPPGYPVLSTLIQAVGLLFSSNNQLHVVHMLAGVMQALTLVVLYFCGLSICRQLFNDVPLWWRRVGCVLLVTLVGSSRLFWQYGQIMEMVQLAGLLLSLIYLLSLHFLESEKQQQISVRLWFGIWFFAGLGVMHQQGLVWLLPGLCVVVLSLYKALENKRDVWKWFATSGFAVGISFFVTMVLLLLRNTHAAWSWRMDDSVEGILRLLLRQDFSGYNIESGSSLIAYLQIPSLTEVVQNLQVFVSQGLWTNSPILLLFSILGVPMLWTKKNSLYVKWFLLLNAGGGLLLALYMNTPALLPSNIYFQSLVILERFYSLIVFPLACIACIGVVGSLQLLLHWTANSPIQEMFLKVGTILAFGLMIVFIGGSYLHRNLSHLTVVDSWADQVLSQANDGLVVCFSDISCFSLLAYQHALNKYMSVSVVPVTPQIVQSGVNESEMSTYNYGFNPDRIFDLIFTALSDGRPVFVAQIDGYYIENLGMESQLLHMIPRGYVQQLSCQLDAQSQSESNLLSEVAVSQLADDSSSYKHALAEFLAHTHEVNATIYGRMGKKTLAAEQIAAGLKLVGDHGPLSTLAQQLPYYAGDADYQTTNVCWTSEYWSHLASECDQAGQSQCSLRYRLWAHLVDLKNPDLLSSYGQELANQGYADLATIQFQKLLASDPDNATAAAFLHKL